MAENDDVPFNRNFPLKPGVVDQVRPEDFAHGTE